VLAKTLITQLPRIKALSQTLSQSPSLQPKQKYLNATSFSGWKRIAYVEWGDEQNPDVVVCVHGLTRNSRDFDTLARALAPRYRVVCMDVIGRGLSDRLDNPDEYNYPRYVVDASLLLARLNVEKVHWIGTSMGGLMGMMMAAMPNPPFRSLVMNDIGSFIPGDALRGLAEYVGKASAFDSLEKVARYLSIIHAAFGPVPDGHWMEMARHSAYEAANGEWFLRYDPAIAKVFLKPIQDRDMTALWVAGQVPTLVLRGAVSTLLTEETLKVMLSTRTDARAITFPGCGHAPSLQPADQIAAIQQFLAEHDH